MTRPALPLSLLVVDDDATVRETLAEWFGQDGHTVRTAATLAEALQAVGDDAPHVVLADLRLPDARGLDVVSQLLGADPGMACVVLTGHADVATAVQAMRAGAMDVLEKPMDLAGLSAAVARAAERTRLAREVAVLRARAGDEAAPADGALDPALDRLVALAARNDDAPVLLLGETGTGKSVVARRIHDRSRRAGEPFVEINCASLSATFLESELFGHERGAFTDARQAKRGLLEVAGGGTIFLDEIAELPVDAQPKLLKVLEEGTFRRLGGTATLRTTARVVAATHQDLAAATADRRFRPDLYYRLQVLTITLPPLRARPDEILGLARALLPRGATLAPAAEAAILGYDWPGNLRELRNALWRAAILAEQSPIGPEHLALPTTAGATPVAAGQVVTMDQAERAAIVAALRATRGNKTQAAEVLGIARSTLNEKVRRLRLGPEGRRGR